ncbi:uncharacterized protein (DUF305 family) [Rhodococcus sp. OK519]|uniref:DUF305 domain-containing protein n=1 Tax=Rhodococcus sp. OK519 TaxID=2135729 RepID=UPI000D47180E|nr:uncharacterized protein (DUF305 family) [Rhodococcus sp. OK519]
MTAIPGWAKTAAIGALILLSMVLGAALRPLIVADDPHGAPVLEATEIAFVQDMAAHHEQALIITQQLDPRADPAVTRLARQIRDGQTAEMGTMLGWLRLAGVTPTNPAPMTWMHPQTAAGHGTHHDESPDVLSPPMPGMATRAEIDALASTGGRDAEILFLQLMQRHHVGGVAMAQAAESQLSDGPVRQTAREMLTTQSQEAGTMALMLTQFGAPLLPVRGR